MSNTLTVAVLAGGRSQEHDVSLRSSEAVAAGLRQSGYVVREITIEHNGRWFCNGKQLQLTPGDGLLDVDLVFPVLHGPYGEDGTVQGLLELLAVPYVGSGVAASAVCMDKILSKDLFASIDVSQVTYCGVLKAAWGSDPAAQIRQIQRLGLPVFVKPARMGSSFGVSCVNSEDQLSDALQAAFAIDERVIVEAASTGLEVECALFEQGDQLRISQPGEIVLTAQTEHGWYDHEAKYTEGGMQLVIPARISEVAAQRVSELAREAFHYAGCKQLARIDFFVEGDTVLLNEINTMPGFTKTSVYPKLWAASGVEFVNLVDGLCQAAMGE